MNIHTDLEAITMVANDYSVKHNCVYSIIIQNPVNGEFGPGSTYEFVTDSYFEKERNCIVVSTTKEALDAAIEEREMAETNKLIEHFSTPYPNGVYGDGIITKADMTKRFAAVRTEPKIQRNALCDCQSGKKYKHCCLKN